MLEQEQERKDRIHQLASHFAQRPGGVMLSRSHTISSGRPNNGIGSAPIGTGFKSTIAALTGGFHAVQLPFTPTAEHALLAFLKSQDPTAATAHQDSTHTNNNVNNNVHGFGTQGMQAIRADIDRVTELALTKGKDAVEMVVMKSIRVGSEEEMEKCLPITLDQPRFLLYLMTQPFRRGIYFHHSFL
jgi:hypothetical protein